MQVRLFWLSLGVLLLVAPAFSQAPAPPQPVVRIPDGGGVGETLQSIFIPPKAGAPFSMTLATKWTRPMDNGGTVTLANQRRIMRDSKGRIYQERWMLVPEGGNIESEMNVFQITDPEEHTGYSCEVRTKVCELLQYRLTTELTYLPPTTTSGNLPDGSGYRLHEDLGSKVTQGVETHGYRETLTVYESVIGNNRPMVNMREYWYSPQLGVSLISIVVSPQRGKQVFTVKNLSMMEPEADLFVVPGDYKILEHRTQNRGGILDPPPAK